MIRKDLMVCHDQSTHTPSPSLLEKGTKDIFKAYAAFEDENKRIDFSCIQLQKCYIVVPSLRAHAKSPEHWLKTHIPFIIKQPICSTLCIDKKITNLSVGSLLWLLILLKGKGNSLIVDLVPSSEALRADYGETEGHPAGLLKNQPDREEGNSPSSKKHTRLGLWVLFKETLKAELWSRNCKKKLTSLLTFALRLHLTLLVLPVQHLLKYQLARSCTPNVQPCPSNIQQHTGDIPFLVWYMQSLVLACHWLPWHCFSSCSHFSSTDVCYLFSLSRSWQSYPFPCHQPLHKHPRCLCNQLFKSSSADKGHSRARKWTPCWDWPKLGHFHKHSTDGNSCF